MYVLHRFWWEICSFLNHCFPIRNVLFFCSCLQIFSLFLFFSSLTNIFGCVFLSVYLVLVCWGGWICGFIFHQIWEIFGWYSYEYYLPAQYLSHSGILKTCMLDIFIVPHRSWVSVLFQPFFCCSVAQNSNFCWSVFKFKFSDFFFLSLFCYWDLKWIFFIVDDVFFS